MNLFHIFRNSEDQVLKELKMDEELYGLANKHGVDNAGELLPVRVHPDTEFIDLPAYWSNLKKEFRDLVCRRGSKYDKVYDELENAQNKFDTYFIPIIASGIALHLKSIEAAVLTPFVRLLVVSVSRLGKEAYCRDGKDLDPNSKI